MPDGRRSLGLIAAALAALALAGLVGVSLPAGAEMRAQRSGYQRCRDVVIRNSDGSIYTQTNGLFQKRAGCRLARRLARRYLANDGIRPPLILGFACDGGGDGVACRRGEKRVTWGYYYDRPIGRTGAE